MPKIEKIIYQSKKSLPKSFFSIPSKIYSGLGFTPEETREEVEDLFELKSKDHDMVLYTDHQNLRLVGIFPKVGATALFGYWETVEAATELNKEAFWLLQADAIAYEKTSLTGPLHFNTFHRYRLRLGETPSWKIFDREPVNPIYYPQILGDLDFRKTLTYESRRIPASEIRNIYRDKKKFVQGIEELPFTIIPLNPENWKNYEEEIYELVESIFNANPGYKTIDPAEFKLLYNLQFSEKLCPYTASLFKDSTTGKLVALTFCHPNYKSIQEEITGTPSFKRDFPKLKNPTMLAKSSGVHPDYRKMNLMNYSGAYVMLSFRELYEDTIFCLMKTDNYSRHFTDGIACEKAFYGLFEKHLGQ
ncbi:hypothetical protein [Autumnicola psychrophila]|uniref:Uncharacterized protein n=1 Tax=Autumnicola psychrophila TaxID=3075592 RepID=A0ABU3DMF3_9FLAO|nr:hypothetical protein [Zunongwangia sp. F225]MDT0684886.1 hypothetical protein [Zunongwangia sp. F225]